MATATAKKVPVVSKEELLELADWERKYTDAKKKASAAERELAFRRQALVEKVLGLQSSDELKALSPERVIRLQDKRFDRGDFTVERGAPLFVFRKSSEGRYPAWSQLYADEFGETAAAEIRANTPVVYSYVVEVSSL